jgi:hypothetical protein
MQVAKVLAFGRLPRNVQDARRTTKLLEDGAARLQPTRISLSGSSKAAAYSYITTIDGGLVRCRLVRLRGLQLQQSVTIRMKQRHFPNVYLTCHSYSSVPSR